MDIERRTNESLLEHHKRLVFGKLIDKTLSDMDYSELAEHVYGRGYSSDVARRMMYGSCKTLELLQAEGISNISNDSVISELDEKIFELRKERQKFYDQRNALNKLLRERSRQEELNEIIVNAVHCGDLPSLEQTENFIVQASSNDILVSLNDLHYGACYANHWGEYNSKVCAEMLTTYLHKILQIAHTHGCENCIIWENGDAISGSIHRSIQVTNKENVIEQIVGVSELIAQFIAELSKYFKTVQFASVSGNHSRVEANKDNSLVEERLDDLIDWYLSARLQNFNNVIIGAHCKIDPTMYILNVRGKNYLGVHGDFDNSYAKVQSLCTLAERPIYAILSGHLHHNKTDSVQGVKTIMAGSFLGMDSYCVQKRIYGHPEQMVCVCDNDGIVCHYDIKLK